MNTIKVNIREQQARYNELMDAMLNHLEVEGAYVIRYSEFEEQGMIYATFTLGDTGDEVPYFGP